MAKVHVVKTAELIRDHTRDQRRRGLEESTIDRRTRIVHDLARWMSRDRRSLLDATAEDIEAFLDSRKIARKARYNYISNLHVFYSWAVLAGHISADPTALVVRPRLRPGLPRPISDNDLELALKLSTRDIRVMLTLAAYQGMRCIEIARLTRDDVLAARDEPLILARGKGDKPRVLPLHPETEMALRALPMPVHGPILHWDDGRPYPSWKVSQLGNEYLHAIGIDASMHRLRHWFGTNLYRTSGRNLLLVRDLMGHSSITTTTGYAAWDRLGAPEAVRSLVVRPGGRHAEVVQSVPSGERGLGWDQGGERTDAIRQERPAGGGHAENGR